MSCLMLGRCRRPQRSRNEFVRTEEAHCPRCGAAITEQTLIQLPGGVEVASAV